MFSKLRALDNWVRHHYNRRFVCPWGAPNFSTTYNDRPLNLASEGYHHRYCPTDQRILQGYGMGA